MNIFKRAACVLLGTSLMFPCALYCAEYKIAVRAKNGIESAINKWQPTVDVLNSKINGHKFTLVPIISLDHLGEMAEKGAFDFVLTNPSSFVEIKARSGARALQTLNNKRSNTAQSRFGSVIFTHVLNEDILTLKDMKNKTLMVVSKPAFGGWRVAWAEFLANGIDPYTDLKAILYADGLQDKVVYAVRDRMAHAGVVRTDQLERMEKKGLIDMRYYRILNSKETKGFPFFHSTRLYPEWPFAVFKNVPEDVARKVKYILHSIPQGSDATKAGHYVGWIEPADYGSVKLLLERLAVTVR